MNMFGIAMQLPLVQLTTTAFIALPYFVDQLLFWAVP